MAKVLIADASKPSLVMSSEVFKDKIPGSVIFVASSGREMLEALGRERPDICLVDFDLPDVDGATLIVALRKIYDGPILMTAFPTEVVDTAVSDLLFHYNDASAWIRKPVRFEALAERIDAYLIFKRRLAKRFDVDMDSRLVAKATGRGKRAPKVSGRIVNISLGGALLLMDHSDRLPKMKNVILSIMVPSDGKTVFVPRPLLQAVPNAPLKGKTKAKTKAKAKPVKLPKIKVEEYKIKAEVAWIDAEGQMGLRFGKLTAAQTKSLEVILRLAAANIIRDQEQQKSKVPHTAA